MAKARLYGQRIPRGNPYAKKAWRSATKRVRYPRLDKDIAELSEAAKQSEASFVTKSVSLIKKWESDVGKDDMPSQLFISIGQISLKLQRPDLADIAFDRVLSLNAWCHIAALGKADCAFQSGDLKNAVEWSGKAYSSNPNALTVSKFFGVLYASGEKKKAANVIAEYVEGALQQETSMSSVFLGMFLATRDERDTKLWLEEFSKNNNFEEPHNVISKAAQFARNLREVHAAPERSSETFVDEYEKASLTGSRKERLLAGRMIAAFSGAGIFWNSVYSRQGVDRHSKEAASFEGYQSPHVTPERPVAASPVRHIKYGY